MTRDEILQIVRWSGHPLDEAQIDIVLRFQAVLADFAKAAYAAGAAAEREACASEVWPTETKVWSEEELQAMTAAFNRAQEKHGWYETLMAVGASVLKMKAAAIRARGNT